MGHIGLNHHEVCELKNLIKLSPSPGESYQLTENNDLGKADVVLVDTDDPLSRRYWKIICGVNSNARPIFVGTSDAIENSSISLKKPIREQKLTEALLKINKLNGFKSKNPAETSLVNENLHVLVADDRHSDAKYMESKLSELIRDALALKV